MQRFFLVFLGQVQGVGFRYTVSRLADKYDITGWVRNRYDGSVECELQGDRNAISNLIKELQTASRFINIEDYSMKAIPFKPGEIGFSVRY